MCSSDLSEQPLLWAHAEYVMLQRSARDGKVFDLIDAVHDRYVRGNGKRTAIEVWTFNRRLPAAPAGTLLRIQANVPFVLHWTDDEWQHPVDTRSQATGIGVDFADIPLKRDQATPIRFTFLWVEESRWEGQDYMVAVEPAESDRGASARAGDTLTSASV